MDRGTIVANTKDAGGRGTKWMCWIARAVGTFVAALFLFIAIVSAFVDPEPPTLEGIVLGVLFLACWWKATRSRVPQSSD